jgi:hypothetical protein
VYFCSSGLELITTLILKKFLNNAARRANLTHKSVSKNLRTELRKYNKTYKATKHAQSSHILQFTRGLELAKFLHFFPERVYLYGNLIQLLVFNKLMLRAKLISSSTGVYYYP